ncbi:UNVERIFIED_ORG: hypothetical protein M2438_001564 [Methylobacterium sp. SuP10 SLI 274]|uniref:hypothetical protein n=1 Tax=Methylorubrum extorquens TaxID=408 RepID=UPI0020A0BB57|nr:hypothetical protein [Methylorubrum extorquens]MDF9862778.1 hypothetical protein [Methylorubrum pseudosasae]MDH6636389.1 hypothetical protein [Methylobacterium sp. SuP10 SLI 274]MDH6665567.1 hypothetical protein [Methylorubrum zatmanii]MCP1557487.1 hypothetical protein [Methylorubrum extorquens]MDF9791074.1 hypothetical protein [Methylorubrum extorquens]
MFRSATVALIVLTTSVALSGELPRYNVEAMCRAAPALEGGARNTDQNCVRDETQARTQLEQQWAGFDARRRETCVEEANIGGPPSYVALLTCMQM